MQFFTARVLRWCTISFLVGILFGSFFIVPIFLLYAGLISTFVFLILSWKHKSFSFYVVLSIIAGLFGLARVNAQVLAHSLLYDVAQSLQTAQQSDSRHKIISEIDGYITNMPYISNSRQHITVRGFVFSANSEPVQIDEHIAVTLPPYPLHGYGEQVHLKGVVTLPEVIQNNDGSEFDYPMYLHKDGIFTVMNNPELRSSSLEVSWSTRVYVRLMQSIMQVSAVFTKAIRHAMPQPAAGFAIGTLLGARAFVSEDIQLAFQRTGLSHILAVSGYNITIIIAAVMGALLVFFHRRIAFWIVLVCIGVFVIATGASASVVRAAIMGCIMLVAERESRMYSGGNALLIAATLMCIQSPLIARYDIGFQLSFGATLGLMAGTPWFAKQFEKIHMKGELSEVLTTTLSAQIFVIPLLILYFHQVSLVFLPMNILVLPFVPWVMLCASIIGILGVIVPSIAFFLGYIFGTLCNILLMIVQWVSALPFAAIDISRSSIISITFVCVAGLLLYWRSSIIPIGQRILKEMTK
jgi:competence protein ComEC